MFEWRHKLDMREIPRTPLMSLLHPTRLDFTVLLTNPRPFLSPMLFLVLRDPDRRLATGAKICRSASFGLQTSPPQSFDSVQHTGGIVLQQREEFFCFSHASIR